MCYSGYIFAKLNNGREVIIKSSTQYIRSYKGRGRVLITIDDNYVSYDEINNYFLVDTYHASQFIFEFLKNKLPDANWDCFVSEEWGDVICPIHRLIKFYKQNKKEYYKHSKNISYELNKFEGTDEYAIAEGIDLYYNDDEDGEMVDSSEVMITWINNEY